jgi:NAD(P)H-flavin reductase
MAIVKKYKAKVEQILNPLPDIFTVSFSSDKKFQYLPGQFLHLALDEYDGIGQWPESRCFSMQSNPDEELLKITFAVKGNYTNRMKNELHEACTEQGRSGKEVWLKLPYGDLFTQSHSKVNTVFIAGGTGITPFLSLFTHESFKEYTTPRIYLGFRSKEYNIYENELPAVERRDGGEKMLHRVTQSRHGEPLSNTANSCTTKIYYENIDGIIDIKTILTENGTDRDYFISGPPIMIKTFRNFLLAEGLDENKIRTDEWE